MSGIREGEDDGQLILKIEAHDVMSCPVRVMSMGSD